jgi:GH18 family chitinase
MVLECNHVWIMENIYANFTSLLRKLYEALKKENMSLILTIFPYTEAFINQLSKIKFEYIAKYTDYFNVMTYDYFTYNNKETAFATQPYNSPINWIGKTLDYYVDPAKPNKEELYKKFLMGMPFHGFMLEKAEKDPKGSILDNNMFSTLVNSGQVRKISWDRTNMEHILEINTQDKEFFGAYPTKRFLKERLNYSKVKKLGGVAIWDIAQGVESFFDEF